MKSGDDCHPERPSDCRPREVIVVEDTQIWPNNKSKLHHHNYYHPRRRRRHQTHEPVRKNLCNSLRDTVCGYVHCSLLECVFRHKRFGRTQATSSLNMAAVRYAEQHCDGNQMIGISKLIPLAKTQCKTIAHIAGRYVSQTHINMNTTEGHN